MANSSKNKHWHAHIKRVHDYFFPHERNAYRPHIFSAWSIGVIAIGLIVINLLYFADTRVVFKKTDFLASVLPGVLTELTNKDREAQALTPVTYDPKLAVAAQLAANDMAAKGYFAHNSPDGKTPWHWLQQAGYNYSYAGQNLAVNFTDSKEVNQAWLNSPTHRANIMKSQYTRVGIAVANGTYNGKEATFVVQYFATPGGAPVASAPTPASVAEVKTVTVANRAHDSTVAVPAAQSTGSSSGAAPAQLASEAPTTTEVLGAAFPSEAPTITVASAKDPSLLTRIAASPHRALLAILTVLMATVIVLLAFAIGTHLRHQYVEVIGGGLVLLAFVMALVLMSSLSATRLQVTPGDQGSTETTVQPA